MQPTDQSLWGTRAKKSDGEQNTFCIFVVHVRNVNVSSKSPMCYPLEWFILRTSYSSKVSVLSTSVWGKKVTNNVFSSSSPVHSKRIFSKIRVIVLLKNTKIFPTLLSMLTPHVTTPSSCNKFHKLLSNFFSVLFQTIITQCLLFSRHDMVVHWQHCKIHAGHDIAIHRIGF